MTETKHTKLPWRCHIGLGFTEIGHWDEKEGWFRVATIDGSPKEVNTDLILRAVNSHEDLVEVCRAVIDTYDWSEPGLPTDTLIRVQAALAKATA